VEDAERIEEGV